MEDNKRKKLQDYINDNLHIWSANKKIQNGVKNYYVSKNIMSTVGLRLLQNQSRIEGLSPVVLCVFTNSLFTTMKELDIEGYKLLDPALYFTDEELEYEKIYFVEKAESDNVIVINDVYRNPLYPNQFICLNWSFQNIAYMTDNSKVRYNFETQRQATVRFVGKEMVKIPTLNNNAINEMIQKHIDGMFVPNTISYNVLHTGLENELEYDEKNHTLTIRLDENTFIDIIDGYHRHIVASKIVEKVPTFQGMFYLNIFNFTVDEANNFIKQENTRTEIDKKHLSKKNPDSFEVLMAKELINYGGIKKNAIFQMIADYDEEIEKSVKYCKFETITMAIKNSFDDITNRNNNMKIVGALVKGFNIILDMSKNKFELDNLEETKSNSVIAHNNMFAFYIAIIANLYKKKYLLGITDFQDKLEKVIVDLDYSFENPKWAELKITDENKVNITKLSIIDSCDIVEYVDELMKDIPCFELDDEDSEIKGA